MKQSVSTKELESSVIRLIYSRRYSTLGHAEVCGIENSAVCSQVLPIDYRPRGCEGLD